MSLNANELQQHVKILRPQVVGRHVFRFLAYSETAFFAILSGEGPHRLTFVLSDENPRLYTAPDGRDVPSLESSFADLLRKELSNAYITGIETVNDDRVVLLSLTIINSVYKEEGRSLYFELIPHHANLILCDEERRILSAFRPGSMEDERPCLKGLRYLVPEKKGFVSEEKAFSEKEYAENCAALEKDLDEKRKKDRFGFLFDEFDRKRKLLERKIKAIEGDVKKAEERLDDGTYGDFIFMNLSSLDPRAESLEVEGRSIPLDPSKTLSTNAQMFYKRAKKARGTVASARVTLAKAKDGLAEVTSSIALLKKADEAGLEELAKSWGLSATKHFGEKKKADHNFSRLSRDSIPYMTDYHGTKILFGKSAKQNDCLTFLLDTSKGHAWLHVNGATGSHVMIKRENPSSDEIRIAAEICLINSGLSDGEVMLANREDVRKGPVAGLAIVKKFRLIRLAKVSPETIELIRNAIKVEL